MKLPSTAANQRVANFSRCFPKKTRLPIFYFLNRILGRLEDELFLVPELTESKGVAVDVGASSGYYAYVMSKYFARVEAFEPLAANTRNLRDYASPNIHVHHLALSATTARRDFYLPIINGRECYGRAGFDRPRSWQYQVTEIEQRPLDDFELRDVSLIKIDVEGHELDVIEGARRTIENCRPVILVEVSNHNKKGAEAFFDQLGYRPHILSAGRVELLAGGIFDSKVGGVNFIYKPA
jgi:FkbM family methyltransferase